MGLLVNHSAIHHEPVRIYAPDGLAALDAAAASASPRVWAWAHSEGYGRRHCSILLLQFYM